jgi:hypothetical protein
MHRCKIRLSSIRSTSASIQCRNAGFLMNASMQDKIMSQKEHQCLHSMQEYRDFVEYIDARQDYEPEEAPMFAFNAGMDEICIL